MPEFNWPENRQIMGQRIERVDGPVKVTGQATYSYDIQRPGMLYAKLLLCPHAHARVTRLDTSQAESLPGVKAVHVIQGEGSEIKWALDDLVIVAAETEEKARDGVNAIDVEYEILPHYVREDELDRAPAVNPGEETIEGDPDAAFSRAAVTAGGHYGLYSMCHSCFEPHGQVCEWEDDQHLVVWASTQNVSGLAGQFSEALDIPAANVRVLTPYMGGGFGSKFGADRWGIECARVAKLAGAPVKLLLERDQELTVAGDRPSAFADVRVAADREGRIIAWESKSWGSGGLGGAGSPPLPYVFQIPDRRHQHSAVPTHVASSRAWRAPNHPQACLITMSALEDLADALGQDPLDFILRNIALTGPRADTYAEELKIGAELIDWKAKWHSRGQGQGTLRRGLGLSLHTWGGRGHSSRSELTLHPDGSVEIKLASQDLGTGTRTVIALVVAETFGLPLEAIEVRIGDNRYPASGASGGSTTVGGVSSSTRRAAQTALEELFVKVAPALGARPEQLVARSGRIQVEGSSSSLSWAEATAKLGVTPLTVSGANPGPGKLIDSGVGGIQMAEVSVDIETGVIQVGKMVAVQDCGLIVDLLTAESQVYGAMIMGIGYALSEEKIMDPATGRMLNSNLEFYKLAGIGDVGELVVHMMSGPGYDERGVIGLGEPPVISPGAAISNAVANAIGVRVPRLPLTPARVLEALEEGGRG